MRTLLLSAAISTALAFIVAPALAQSTYDEGWYRAPFWSGEYPGGFSVVQATTVQLRPSLDPVAEKSIACDLPQGATYQAWNLERVEDQGLAFVSFTRIADYKMTESFEATVYRRDDASEVKLALMDGDSWRYLVYLAEGAFLMEYGGVIYDGTQDLFEHSEQVGDEDGYEEWLRINCPNNQWGWLYMGDIAIDQGQFIAANITEYGVSKDLE